MRARGPFRRAARGGNPRPRRGRSSSIFAALRDLSSRCSRNCSAVARSSAEGSSPFGGLGPQRSAIQIGEPGRKDEIIGGEFEGAAAQFLDEDEILFGEGEDRDLVRSTLLRRASSSSPDRAGPRNVDIDDERNPYPPRPALGRPSSNAMISAMPNLVESPPRLVARCRFHAVTRPGKQSNRAARAHPQDENPRTGALGASVSAASPTPRGPSPGERRASRPPHPASRVKSPRQCYRDIANPPRKQPAHASRKRRRARACRHQSLHQQPEADSRPGLSSLN